MTRIRVRACAIAIALTGAIATFGAQAQTQAQTPQAPAPAVQPAAPAISTTPTAGTLLDGKLNYTLPAGFSAQKLPTNSGAGTMHINPITKQLAVITDTAVPNNKGNTSDPEFLPNMAKEWEQHQRQAMQDFTKDGEKTIKLSNGLAVRQIDTTGTMQGTKVKTTTLLSGVGERVSIIQLMTEDTKNKDHSDLVGKVVASLK